MSFAWLVGLQIGEVKKEGNWAAFVGLPETGIASVDSNLNDNEVAGGALNMRGFKLGLAYAVSDSVVSAGHRVYFPQSGQNALRRPGHQRGRHRADTAPMTK